METGVIGQELLSRVDEWQSLLKFIGHDWTDQGLLLQAFRHSSWCNQQATKIDSNERLEFLGDAVLDLLSAEYLYLKMPDAREGALSNARTNIVRASALVRCAKRLNLGAFLVVGRGSEHLRTVDSVLGDTVEAVLGAAYLDGGLEVARRVAWNVGVLS